jgi:hypothetical protein
MKIELSKDEAQLLLVALDGHVRQNGLSVAGQAVGLAVKIQLSASERSKEVPVEADIPEAEGNI